MALPRPSMKALTVGQLAPREPVATVADTASVKEASRVMQDRGTEAVLVVDPNRRPLGLLTARDIVMKVTNAGRDPAEAPVTAVMAAPLMAVSQHEDIGQAIALMVHRQITHLPVLGADGRVASLLTLSDILHLHLAGTVDLADIATRLIEQDQAPATAPVEPASLEPAEPAVTMPSETPEGLESALEFKSGGQQAALGAPVVVPPIAVKPVRKGHPAGRSNIEKHRSRTPLQRVQRAISKNRGLIVICGLLAIVLFFSGWLAVKILGLFDVYQASHYEPKDTERQQMLEGGK